MALDINGYNTDFNAFVKFAQNSFVTNDKTAVYASRSGLFWQWLRVMDEMSVRPLGTLEPFIETALLWSRMIADYRPSVDVPMEFTESTGGDVPGLMSV